MAEFDKYGRLKNPNFRAYSSFTPSYSYSRSSGSLWSRANGFVVGIGNWLAENFESLADNAALILYFGAWLVYGIGVIVTWVGEGFGSALLTAVVGGVLVYYGAAIAMFLFGLALKIFLGALRFVCLNIYTLLLTVCVIVGMQVWPLLALYFL